MTSFTSISGSTSFNAASPANTQPLTSTQTNNILWGTLAAAAIGAFTADAVRKKQEEEKKAFDELLAKQKADAEAAEEAELAARAVLKAARYNAHDDNGGGMTYKQIGQAYQVSLNTFKATLNKAVTELGLSTTAAEQYLKDAKNNGFIGPQLAKMQNEVKQIKEEQEKAAEMAYYAAVRQAQIDAEKKAAEANAQKAQSASGAKFAMPALDGPPKPWWQKLLETIGLGWLIPLSSTPTPAATPTSLIDAQYTQVAQIQTAMPTSIPTATPLPFNFFGQNIADWTKSNFQQSAHELGFFQFDFNNDNWRMEGTSRVKVIVQTLVP